MRNLVFIWGTGVLICPVGGNASPSLCPATSIKHLIECIENRSPESEIAKLKMQSAEDAERSMGVLPNPELELEHSRANKNGGMETQAALLFDINPTKLSAESSLAKAQTDLVKAESKIALSQIRADLLKTFRKIQNTAKLLEVAKESQVTFSKVVKQYSSRPRLSPEREASLDLFRLAEKESVAKAIDLQRELDTHFFELEQRFLVKLEKIESSFWQIKKWPSAPSKQESLSSSPYAKEITANKVLAEADYKRAQAESWPDLKIGPLVNFSEDNTEKFRSYGLRLSLPLPLFNLNRGGRASARKKLAIAEIQERRGLTELEFNEGLLTRFYSQSVDLLSKLPSESALKKNHEKLERMFLQGIIPSSLMIDAHQELFDSLEKFAETEQQALTALFTLQIHSGVEVGRGLL